LVACKESRSDKSQLPRKINIGSYRLLFNRKDLKDDEGRKGLEIGKCNIIFEAILKKENRK